MPPQAPTPPHYTEQQFLNFFPLPHWQGWLRPTFFSALIGFMGFNNRFRSLTSSGFSGSNPMRKFHPCTWNVDVTSANLDLDCTLTMAGFFSVPNFPVFLVPNMFVLLPASTLLFILPISEILFPISSLFHLLPDLAIETILAVRVVVTSCLASPSLQIVDLLLPHAAQPRVDFDSRSSLACDRDWWEEAAMERHSYAPVPLRLVMGIILSMAGYMKLVGIAAMIDYFTKLGFPIPLVTDGLSPCLKWAAESRWF
jgi:hypothetical protein